MVFSCSVIIVMRLDENKHVKGMVIFEDLKELDVARLGSVREF